MASKDTKTPNVKKSPRKPLPAKCLLLPSDIELTGGYVPIKHPTEQFRAFPVCPLETAPPDQPVGAQLLPPSKSPMRKPSASPTKTPVTSPEKLVVETDYLHCCHCNRLLSSSECDVVCHHSRIPKRAPKTLCLVHSEKKRQQISTITAHFGVNLSPATVPSEMSCLSNAPLVIVKCVDQIENWCITHLESLDVYEVKADKAEINAVKKLFEEGKYMEVTVSNHSVYAISGALKEYLWKLPDPVIPISMYDDFLAVARMAKKSEFALHELVDCLPDAHKSTLKFLFAHLVRLMRWQLETDNWDRIRNCFYAFCNILLRPSEKRITEIVDNSYLHVNILYKLVTWGDWGEFLPTKKFPHLSAIHPPQPSNIYLPQQTPEERLKNCGWYWGKITRADVREILKDQRNGSFLVRDAITPGDHYTLTVKYVGLSHLIKIMYDEKSKLYGLAKPFEFSSVVTIINWYQHNSLAEYNSWLDTKLLYPVNCIVPETPPDDLDKEGKRLCIINQNRVIKHAQYNFLLELYRWESFDNVIKEHVLDSFKDILDLFREQLSKLTEESLVSADNEKQRIQDSMQILQTCCKEIQTSESKIKLSVEKQVSYIRMLNAELISLATHVNKLVKQCVWWRDWLLEHGKTHNFLDILMGKNISGANDPRLLIENESTWLIDCNRKDAEKLLGGKPDGTFLIRPKPEENIHVLSIKYLNSRHHCHIYHDSTGYGFSGSKPFATLKDLVIYHHFMSLVKQNAKLDVCLKIPAKTLNPVISSP